MADVDVAALYAEGRKRITELLEGVSDEEAKTAVPTCPQWSVHDVAAHLAGTCADVLSGNLAGVATDPWTAAQVEARRDKSLAEIVAEWNEVAPQVEAFANNFPGRVGEQWVLDMTTHEHDVRLGLGRQGARDSACVRVGADFMVSMGLHETLSAHGLGPIEVRSESKTWVVGGERTAPSGALGAQDEAGEQFFAAISEGREVPSSGESVGTLEASDFELMRALTGRRSLRQIAAMSWSVDPDPYAKVFEFGPFTISPTDIDE